MTDSASTPSKAKPRNTKRRNLIQRLGYTGLILAASLGPALGSRRIDPAAVLRSE